MSILKFESGNSQIGSTSATHSTMMSGETHVHCPILYYHGHFRSHSLVYFLLQLSTINSQLSGIEASRIIMQKFQRKFTILIKLSQKHSDYMILPTAWEKLSKICTSTWSSIYGEWGVLVTWTCQCCENLRNMLTLPEKSWVVRFLLLTSCLVIRQNFCFVQLWQNTSKNL